jgi:hypothetical protein
MQVKSIVAETKMVRSFYEECKPIWEALSLEERRAVNIPQQLKKLLSHSREGAGLLLSTRVIDLPMTTFAPAEIIRMAAQVPQAKQTLLRR